MVDFYGCLDSKGIVKGGIETWFRDSWENNARPAVLMAI